MINCVFFDWDATLAKPGSRDIFMYNLDLITRLQTLDPHALGILGYLRSKGIKIGIITNTKKDHLVFEKALHETGLTNFIDPELIFISSDPRYCAKPCPQIFQAALRESGCSPAEALFVGDSCRADVQGARGVGMKVAYLNRRSCRFPGDYHLHELSQLVYIV